MHVDIGEAFSFVSPCRHRYKQKNMLYAFFWVIPRCLNFMCRHFGTLCSIFIGRYLPMKMEETESLKSRNSYAPTHTM